MAIAITSLLYLFFMRILLVLFALFSQIPLLIAANVYISPEGDNQNSGLSADQPLKNIAIGFQYATAGDTLFLLPGIHEGRNYIVDKHGTPDLPITIISLETNPQNFAIIDAQGEAAEDSGFVGFLLKESSWINIENIVFRNCWTYVVDILDSEYISIKSCHFTSGKRIVSPVGHGSHHILVENCYAKHPEEVWKGWSWEELHHGSVSHYNGGLLHPKESGGGHIMRGNMIINLFNAFRTRPVQISEDGNIEIYNNTLLNIRDNDFEPETWAWNMHYYYNRHVNIHKVFSIDDVEGGNIYIYGNTYTQTKDDWAIEEVSGIFKYSDGPITYPCYAFNNSYYTEAEVLRAGESTNHQLKHYNNAYHFFDGSQRFELYEWQPGYEFNYDCINQEWPQNIINNTQEINGLSFTEPMFVDGEEGDFQLQEESPCIDAGKIMALPEFQWTQRYTGNAPDIGAYEGNQLTDGPAFRFIPSPGGAFYEERPRISKHRLDDNLLYLYFSAELDSTTISSTDLSVFENGVALSIDSIFFPSHAFELCIALQGNPNQQNLSLLFHTKPIGANGLQLTYWASTIPIGISRPNLPDLSTIPEVISPATEAVPDFSIGKLEIVPNPATDSSQAILTLPFPLSRKYVDRLAIYTPNGDQLPDYYPKSIEGNKAIFELGKLNLPSGIYFARVRAGNKVLTTKFVIP